ncbi:protein kinase domain-containing protein [Frankia sp. CiP1_Cm_nod2]|uniref:protein kinase domain-containing protein n=1 Tax=Frankia sp. CiP1_Cm_nod2 TaxID=2897161 RepID=UPI002024F2DD
MLAPLTDADPRKIGRYWLQGRLGAGGMGAVYLGFDEDGHPMAVKVVRPELTGDADFRERFRREVAAARRVRGRFVAEVRDADVDAERPWMATEYVDGVSLSAAIGERGRLSGSMLVDLAASLADALAAIHAAGLVHRDLKPSNILLAWDGPKVIDFGIAHAVDTTEHTQTGHIIGTVAWMAPEQLRGERAGPAADIFSWAMCVAFAATGRHLFAADTPTASALRMLREKPDLSGIPDGLTALLRRALDRDPARRPTAVELVTGIVRNYPGSADLADQVTRRVLVAPQPPPPPMAGAGAGAGTADRVRPPRVAKRPGAPAGGRPGTAAAGALRRWQLALITVAAGIALGVTTGLVMAVAMRVTPDGGTNPPGAMATPSGAPAPGGGATPPAASRPWVSAPPAAAGLALTRPPDSVAWTSAEQPAGTPPPSPQPEQPGQPAPAPGGGNGTQPSPRAPATPAEPAPSATAQPPATATPTKPAPTSPAPVPSRTAQSPTSAPTKPPASPSGAPTTAPAGPPSAAASPAAASPAAAPPRASSTQAVSQTSRPRPTARPRSPTNRDQRAPSKPAGPAGTAGTAGTAGRPVATAGQGPANPSATTDAATSGGGFTPRGPARADPARQGPTRQGPATRTAVIHPPRMPIGTISDSGASDHSIRVRTPLTRGGGWLPRTLTDWLTGAAGWRDNHGIHWLPVVHPSLLHVLAVTVGALPLLRGAGPTTRPRRCPSPAVRRSPGQASTSDGGYSLTFTA